MGKDRLYGSLRRILNMAYDQASIGKGKERHANDLPFEKQTMMEANQVTNGGFGWGQIFKKIKEIPNIKDPDMKKAEMLSIIVYAAGWVLWYEGFVKKGEARGNLDNITGVVDSKGLPRMEE